MSDEIIKVLREKPVVIAGPCAIESYDQVKAIADKISAMGVKILRGGAFKPRTSPASFQGLGMNGLMHMRKAADANGMYVVSEIMDSKDLDACYDLLDMIQIGSKNMSSFGLLKAIAQKTKDDKKPVLLKRGISSTLNELIKASEYITSEGNPNVILCLRGIRTFEQIDSSFRFTPDLASIIELKERTDLLVIFDPSHSAGASRYVEQLSMAALSLGFDGILVECHDHPENALCDGKQSILPSQLKRILESCGNYSKKH